ncbi:grasp-with-spasm system SPASM domain peptide maturase [Chryseobacterium lacus]|uniref:grasp-with-spasm system SPASM domain peptide maturase n=1 Tax=Chryseobacterium lacus TaxID=2058346 RepID=UPI000F87B9E8|nr:grasp-with-spasm system SPASM domain peptide maturase [Chryseobacterium lacus]RST27571.1 grasp-with-spasm system SPASM domain peptide maturase [Chryseobacterium lacus]
MKSVEIITPYNSNFDEDFLHKISIDFERITSLYIYNSPFNKRTEWNNKILMDVIFAKKNYTDFRFCGGVNIETFNTNLPKVLEAINHNSCLHKKNSIDVDGNIRNCPSMPQSFGNIKDTTLEEALEHPDFKKYWNLTKDHIEVCKDCEFRYICTDCRAYTERTHENSEGLDTSKPLKCGYNPYTGKWAEWSTNPLKEKAIEFYGMEDLVKK